MCVSTDWSGDTGRSFENGVWEILMSCKPREYFAKRVGEHGLIEVRAVIPGTSLWTQIDILTRWKEDKEREVRKLEKAIKDVEASVWDSEEE